MVLYQKDRNTPPSARSQYQVLIRGCTKAVASPARDLASCLAPIPCPLSWPPPWPVPSPLPCTSAGVVATDIFRSMNPLAGLLVRLGSQALGKSVAQVWAMDYGLWAVGCGLWAMDVSTSVRMGRGVCMRMGRAVGVGVGGGMHMRMR